MQPLDNHMDDLMRRAAEDYPLNTDSSDWDKVFQALHQEPEEKKRRFFWLWIYALPAAAVLTLGTLGILHHQPARKKTDVATNHVILQEKVTGTASGHDLPASVAAQSLESRTANSINPAAAGQKTHASTQGEQHLTSNMDHLISSNVLVPSRRQQPAQRNMRDKASIHAKSTEHREIAETNRSSLGSPSVPSARTTIKHLSSLPATSLFNLYTTATPSIIVSATEVAAEKRRGSVAHLYVTLMAGIDESNIKMQKASSPGYTAGVLASYRFTKRFSVEGGVWWDRKAYYTKGEYFNMKLYSNQTIESVDGICSMIELPLLLQYRLSGGETHYWFASAGISSYLMKKEDYEYEYATGSAIPAEGYKSFKNSTNNWLSVARVSGGFSTLIGHLGSLRIEPYAGLPLGGLGVGKLPITSAGVNIGLTRKLF